MSELLVDPEVTRTKFDREVEVFRSNAAHHRQRGCFLVGAECPRAEFVFGIPQLRPPAVLFGVTVDFANYDLWAPSVRFTEPFSGVALPAERTPRMARVLAGGELGNLVQGYQGEPAFLCIPGTREYHDNPGHSGDSWLLHRGLGEGTLNHLLDVIHKYAVEPINGFQIGIQVQIGSVTYSGIPE
jgi:hypothetical protein